MNFIKLSFTYFFLEHIIALFFPAINDFAVPVVLKLRYHQSFVGPPCGDQFCYCWYFFNVSYFSVKLVKGEHGPAEDHHRDHQQGYDDVDGNCRVKCRGYVQADHIGAEGGGEEGQPVGEEETLDAKDGIGHCQEKKRLERGLILDEIVRKEKIQVELL